jgi:hypothetical protein
MPDVIEAKHTATQFQPHPEGQFVVRCVDAINMGQKVESFQGAPPKLVQKCVLVFQSGEKNEDGRLHEVSAEMTISMGERANLRKLLEQWRGKSYTDEQARAGVPVHKLVGQPALMTVEHKKSNSGRIYAKISSIAPLPKAMQNAVPELPAYARPAFWQERKDEYATEVSKFLAAQQSSPAFDDVPDGLGEDDDDDLPF